MQKHWMRLCYVISLNSVDAAWKNEIRINFYFEQVCIMETMLVSKECKTINGGENHTNADNNTAEDADVCVP